MNTHHYRLMYGSYGTLRLAWHLEKATPAPKKGTRKGRPSRFGTLCAEFPPCTTPPAHLVEHRAGE